MAVSLVPVGPGIPAEVAAVLKSHEEALRQLQQPGAPTPLARIDTKANLALVLASDYPECALICDEINSIVVSTLVTGAYAWLRADGSAL